MFSTCRRPFVALLAIALAGCASATEPGSKKVTVDEVSVIPDVVALTVGETMQLSALAFDRAGKAVTTAPTWTSSDARIASVSSTGQVSAVGIGTTAITATVGGMPGIAIVTVAPNSLDLTVENQLIYSVNVSSGGVLLGTVGAQSTRQLTGPGLPPNSPVEWELVRPLLSNRPLGDPMAGTFTTASSTTGPRRIVINNLVGSTYFFAPVINNLTATDLLMVVNHQLASENRCSCVVPAGRTSVVFGYYKLFTNSNVTAFRSGSNYTGAYNYFYDFGASIQVGSGRREFTYTNAP